MRAGLFNSVFVAAKMRGRLVNAARVTVCVCARACDGVCVCVTVCDVCMYCQCGDTVHVQPMYIIMCACVSVRARPCVIVNT